MDQAEHATSGHVTKPAAIRRVASLIDVGELSQDASRFLTGFSLALACRRALDMAQFLHPHHPDMGDMKFQQASCQGVSRRR